MKISESFLKRLVEDCAQCSAAPVPQPTMLDTTIGMSHVGDEGDASCSHHAEDVEHELTHALATLRLAYLAHQQAHWESRGTGYYGDHQLYERLYGTAQDGTDRLAERIAGLFGWPTIDLMDQLDQFIECDGCVAIIETGDHFQRSLEAERHALESLEHAFKAADAAGALTLGLDDLLMALSSDREEALYLLGQRSEME